MIILLFNIEVVVLTYFRDTGCFFNYYYHYIIIIILLLLLRVVSQHLYIYISPSGAESTTVDSEMMHPNHKHLSK